MLNIVLIDDNLPINTRNTKILNSLAAHYGEEANISVITWERGRTTKDAPTGYYVYHKESQLGKRVRKLLNLWGYRKFCRHTIRSLNPDLVIASHWNNLLLVPKLDRSRQMLIYEDLDVPTASTVIRKIITTLEHKKMQQVDLTIHASRFYLKLYPPSFNQFVLENKPPFEAPVQQTFTIQEPLRISFIGNLRYPDILKNIIDAVRGDKRFHLYFHGDGQSLKTLKMHADGVPNVSFTGYFTYENVVLLYQQTDVVWAAYPNKNFNVKYAISNKFHESLLFGTPAIYSDNTHLGDYVCENNIGMVVNPYSVEAIKQLFDSISTGNIDLKKMHNDMIRFQATQTTWDDDMKEVIRQIEQFFK